MPAPARTQTRRRKVGHSDGGAADSTVTRRIRDDAAAPPMQTQHQAIFSPSWQSAAPHPFFSQTSRSLFEVVFIPGIRQGTSLCSNTVLDNLSHALNKASVLISTTRSCYSYCSQWELSIQQLTCSVNVQLTHYDETRPTKRRQRPSGRRRTQTSPADLQLTLRRTSNGTIQQRPILERRDVRKQAGSVRSQRRCAQGRQHRRPFKWRVI